MREILIALGGNLNTPVTTLPQAWEVVVRRLDLRDAALSPLVWSAPAEQATGGQFTNAVGVGMCAAEPAEILAQLHVIEAAFGRDRVAEGHHGSRPLDLDLLAVADLCMDTPDLRLPHPRIANRDFVLVPLLALRPRWVEPRSGRAAVELLADLPASARHLEPRAEVQPRESADYSALERG